MEPQPAHSTQRLLRALSEYSISGIATNLGFFREILADERFRAGDLHTGFIDEFFARRGPAPATPDDLLQAAAMVAHKLGPAAKPSTATPPARVESRWLAAGRGTLLR